MPQPLVSIIIPTYNRANLLSETLDSVIAQTYQNWECLVIDDGSEEETLQLIRNYTQNDRRFKFLFRNKEKRKGGSVCRNIGIENALGEYIIFLDSDDLMLKHCLFQRIDFMKNGREIDFAVFQMGILNEGKIYENKKITRYDLKPLKKFISHDLLWPISAPIWRKSFLINNNLYFDERFPRLQDPEFTTKALLVDFVNFKILENSKPDILYRVYAGRKPDIENGIKGYSIYLCTFSSLLKEKDLLLCLGDTYKKMIEYYKSLENLENNPYENIKNILKANWVLYQNNVFTFKETFLNFLVIIKLVIKKII